MKFFCRLLVALITGYSFSVGAQMDAHGKEIIQEFNRLYKMANRLTPEFEVGGFLYGKNYGDHKFMWRLADTADGNDYIRIYRALPNNQAFEISFHRSSLIIPGRQVIRRFYGPATGGWRNDTVDANTGEYLGRQGTEKPRLALRDAEIMDKWCVKLLE